MYLKSIYLYNFKNFHEAELAFCEGVNCFIGHNGAGKTNLLDAIHYLSFTKSYFGSFDLQNILHGEDSFSVTGRYSIDTNETQEVPIQCMQKRGDKKVMRIDGKVYDRMSLHIGKVPLIMIAPQDAELIIGGSDLRRKFIDRVLSQLDRNYLEYLLAYNRALTQRNAVLKQEKPDTSLMELFGEELISNGKIIFAEREKFIEKFLPVFEKYYEKMSAGIEKVNIIYNSQLYENTFEDILLKNADRDRFLQYTTGGIHKDDLEFLMDGYPVRKVGSQGQQKSFLLSLRFAEWEIMFNEMNVKPILLLDDIFDRLDNERSKNLMNVINEFPFGQVFISDTDKNRMENFLSGKHRIFFVENGTIVDV